MAPENYENQDGVDEELITDLITFKEKQSKLRQAKWNNIQEKIETAKNKYYVQWRKKYFSCY